MVSEAKVAVWDIPTRLFHWALVLFFIVSWRSAESHAMEWHYLSGSIMVGLVIFRLLWGVMGSNTARFASFVRSPSQVFAYVRSGKEHARAPGHNPLGGYSVLAMLALLIAQVGTGLLAVDTDGLESGPLSYLVSFDQGRLAAEVHEASFNLLIALVGLHILAIIYYTVVRKHRLLRAMITGSDAGIAPGEGTLTRAPAWRFVVALLIAAGLAWWISKGAPF